MWKGGSLTTLVDVTPSTKQAALGHSIYMLFLYDAHHRSRRAPRQHANDSTFRMGQELPAESKVMDPKSDREADEFLAWALEQLQFRWAGFRKVRKQVHKRIRKRVVELGLESNL